MSDNSTRNVLATFPDWYIKLVPPGESQNWLATFCDRNGDDMAYGGGATAGMALQALERTAKKMLEYPPFATTTEGKQ